MKIYALPLLLLPLSALAEGERLPYICDNGSSINISFSADLSGRPQATLHFSDATITLPQVPSSSGVLYRIEEIRLHTQADEAIFEDGKGNIRRCKQGSAMPVAKATAPTATSSFVDISGRIFYYSRAALPADAVLIVQVQDTARARPRTLAEQQIELSQQTVPVSFQTTIDRDLIGKKGRVTVNAHIKQNGKVLFSNKTSYPAMRQGQPLYVDMQLQQVASGLPH